MVVAMSDAYNDPSGNTAQFQAFVAEPESAPQPRRVGIAIAGAVVAAIAVAILLWAVI